MLTPTALDADFRRILAGVPSALRDPYPVYNAMREQAEIYMYNGTVPVVTTHRAVRQISMDDKNFLVHRGLDRFKLEELNDTDRMRIEAICRFEQLQISGLNGDAHKRVRSAAQQGFGSLRAADMTSYVERLVSKLADDMVVEGGVVDIIDLAYRIPLLVVMRLLGAPEEDIDLLRGWSDDIAGVKQFVGAELSVERIRAAYDSTKQLKTYIGDMAKELRRKPNRTHLMGLLLDAEESNQLSAEELSSTFVVIFYAGHETTTNLLANGVLEMLRHRSEWKRLADDPSLASSAVEEVLRYNPPVQMIVRRAAEDTTVFDTFIESGTSVMLLYGSASRDPLAFDNPDVFDIRRTQNKHFGFGHGVHVCLGAALARNEGRIVFEHLARRFPDMELAVDPAELEWHPHAVFHGMKHLPVRLGRDRGFTR